MEIPDDGTAQRIDGSGGRIRYRMHAEIFYTRYLEFLTAFAEIRAYEAKMEWSAARLWSPVAGRTNHVVVEWCYPDLAGFDREHVMRTHDPGYRAFIRKAAEITVQGSASTELLQEGAPSVPRALKPA